MGVRLPALVWLTVCAAACRIDVDYDATRYRCQDGRCPIGYMCVNDVCERGEPDAAAAPIDAAGPPPEADAAPGTPDAAPVPPGPRCGAPSLLTDDFDDNQRAPEWDWAYQSGGSVASETGGRVVVTVVSEGGASEAGYVSRHTYDLRDGAVWLEVPQMVNLATHAYAFLSAGPDPANQLAIVQLQGTLYFGARLGGADVIMAQAPYDPALHRWWRIREAGGTVRWDTSPDGVAWTERASAPAAISVSIVRLGFGAGIASAGSVFGGRAEFDRFNGGGAPTGVWCKASSLVDDFDDGVRGRAWGLSWESGGCTLAEPGGRARVTPPPGPATATCAYATSARYDLADDAVTVEVPVMVNTATTTDAYLAVLVDGDNLLRTVEEAGTLYFQRYVGGTKTNLAFVAYEPALHRWWRIREQGGVVRFQTAPDGVAWTTRAEIATPFPVDAVTVQLAAGTWEPVASPGFVEFDRYNLPP